MQNIDVPEFLVRFYSKLTVEEAQFCEAVDLQTLLTEAMEAYFDKYSSWIEEWRHVTSVFVMRRELFWKMLVCFSCHVESRMFFTSRSQCGNRFLNLMNQISRGLI